MMWINGTQVIELEDVKNLSLVDVAESSALHVSLVLVLRSETD